MLLVVLVLMPYAGQKSKRLVVLLSGLAAIFALSASGPVSAQSHADAARSVYSAVFDSLFHQGSESPGMIVLADSTSWEAGGAVYKGRLQQAHKSVIGQEVIDDFSARVAPPVALDQTSFSYSKPIAFVSNADALRLAALGKRLGPPQSPYEYRFTDWAYGFAKEYPRAWGVTAVSPVGLNSAETEALVFVAHFCGICSHLETFYLRKLGRTWRVIERIPLRQQDGLGPGEIRYLGPTPQFLPRLRRTQDSTRKAIADSVLRSKAPRLIRGRVTSRQTGLPVPFAQVFSQTAPQVYPPPPNSNLFQRTVADAKGRFQIRQPALGAMHVNVECPGTQMRNSMTLDDRAFWVHAEMDTALDLQVYDIEPCWYPRHIHSIESGELQSDEFLESAVPSADERAVYGAVLGDLLRDSSGAATGFMISARTSAQCRIAWPCRLPVARLLRARLMDSTTMLDFRLKRLERDPLNPKFANEAGSSLLSAGGRSYLEGEGHWIEYQSDSGTLKTSGFWRALQIVHPGTRAIVSLSRPGINTEHTQAIVEIMLETETGSTRTKTFLLNKAAGEWKIDRRRPGNRPISGALAGGKCIATEPGPIPSDEELSLIRGDYLFTLVPDSVSGGSITTWRARFVADTTKYKAVDRNRLSPTQLKAYDLHQQFPLPRFGVFDPATGKHVPYREAGIFVRSAERSFSSISDMLQFDGSGITVDIRKVAGGALFGSWERYSYGVMVDSLGNEVPEPSGYFCAERVRARK